MVIVCLQIFRVKKCLKKKQNLIDDDLEKSLSDESDNESDHNSIDEYNE